MTVLEIDGPQEELCPGEIVTVEASTDGSTVGWWVNDTPAESMGYTNINGNTFKLGGGGTPGTPVKVSASDSDNTLSILITWKEAAIEIELDPDPGIAPYEITAEPHMEPTVIIAKAIGIGGPVSVIEWQASVGIPKFDDCPPNGPLDLDTTVDLAPAGSGDRITLDLTSVINGGGIYISVRGVVNGCERLGGASEGINGTNPQRSDIQAALPHDTLRRIACLESGQRQFDCPPDGGVDFCPLFGLGGKVGIMQIPEPTAEEVWNWRANVAKGIEIFQEKVTAARDYPDKVRNSATFQGFVDQINQNRQQAGKDPIQVVLPDFTTGNFDDDLQQLELDAVRGYNGWFGTDQFGFELHEYRVEFEFVNGEEVLRVTDINDLTLEGAAVWERVQVADRPSDEGDPNYVDSVLAFLPDCTPAIPAPTPCEIEIVDWAGNPPDLSVSVGKLIRLEARIVAPKGATFTSIEWEIDGKIVKDYSADIGDDGMAIVDPISPTDLKGNRIEIYWVDAPRSAIPGETSTFVMVSVNAVVNGTDNCTAHLQYLLHRPYVYRFEVVRTGSIAADSHYGFESTICSITNWLRFGSATDPGIRWEADVTTGAGGAGQLAFVQLISRDSRAIVNGASRQSLRTTSGNQYVLDGDFIYGPGRPPAPVALGSNRRTVLEDNDAPAAHLDSCTPGQSIVSRSRHDSFKTYLMYRPNGANSIWIPLSRLDWGWCALASEDPSSPTGWDLDPRSFHFPTINTRGVDTDEFPTWFTKNNSLPIFRGAAPTPCPSPPSR